MCRKRVRQQHLLGLLIQLEACGFSALLIMKCITNPSACHDIYDPPFESRGRGRCVAAIAIALYLENNRHFPDDVLFRHL